MTNYYSSEPVFLNKGVVLCQHGFKGNGNNFNGMFEILNGIAGSTTISLSNVVLKASNINNPSVVSHLQNQAAIRKVSFFKTEFANDIGRVNDQVSELHQIITKIKLIFGADIPIFLVGHSKGGLVNMKYCITHPGVVQNITSIGTPYENSAIQFLCAISDDLLSCAALLQADRRVGLILNALAILADQFLADEDLGSPSFFATLKSSWRNLSQKPYITTIGASQIAWTNNPNTGSDFLVDLSSQKADNYQNINERVVVSENFVYVIRTDWYDYLYALTPVAAAELVANVIQALMELFTTHDVLAAGFGLALAIIPYTWDLSIYDSIHTRELRNQTVCYKVLSAINKSNPANTGGYQYE